jgi:uncharacterized protein
MVRNKKCWMVSSVPDVTYFKPAGISCRLLSEVNLSVEEAEALRLKDLEGLEQAEGAVSMGVSRPTFQRILSSARKTVADALLNGKAIRIDGGSFKLTSVPMCCPKGHIWTGEQDNDNKTTSCTLCRGLDSKVEPPCCQSIAGETKNPV